MAVLCSKVQAEAGMSIGAQLRASREARGLSIDAVAHTTRVQPRILAAIERDDVRAVPPRPFGRGFVKAYAREIGLDGDQTTRDYFAQFAPVVPADATRSPETAASTRHRVATRSGDSHSRRSARSPRSRSLSWRAGRRRRLNRRPVLRTSWEHQAWRVRRRRHPPRRRQTRHRWPPPSAPPRHKPLLPSRRRHSPSS